MTPAKLVGGQGNEPGKGRKPTNRVCCWGQTEPSSSKRQDGAPERHPNPRRQRGSWVLIDRSGHHQLRTAFRDSNSSAAAFSALCWPGTILQTEQKSAGRGSPDLQASSTEQVVEMEIKQTGHRLYLPQPCKNFLHPHSLLHVLHHLCTEETYHRSFRIPDLAPRIPMVLFIY